MGIVYPWTRFSRIVSNTAGMKMAAFGFFGNRKNKVRLSVEDNGIGIRPEELGRVFEKGFCGTNGRSGRYSTGIGLYLEETVTDSEWESVSNRNTVSIHGYGCSFLKVIFRRSDGRKPFKIEDCGKELRYNSRMFLVILRTQQKVSFEHS